MRCPGAPLAVVVLPQLLGGGPGGVAAQPDGMIRNSSCGGPSPVMLKGVEKGAAVSALEATMTGTIRTVRVDKGFGFIKDDSGKEYFFHQSAVYGEGLENLREGDSVEFDVGQGPKGPRAENVRRTST